MEGFQEALKAGRAPEAEADDIEEQMFSERPAVIGFQRSAITGDPAESDQLLYVRKDLFDRVAAGDFGAVQEVQQRAAGL